MNDVDIWVLFEVVVEVDEMMDEVFFIRLSIDYIFFCGLYRVVDRKGLEVI